MLQNRRLVVRHDVLPSLAKPELSEIVDELKPIRVQHLWKGWCKKFEPISTDVGNGSAPKNPTHLPCDFVCAVLNYSSLSLPSSFRKHGDPPPKNLSI